jgi:hypothetical protein
MSGNLSFHFSLTIISYARHLTISTYQTTALGEYSFLKSKLTNQVVLINFINPGFNVLMTPFSKL